MSKVEDQSYEVTVKLTFDRLYFDYDLEQLAHDLVGWIPGAQNARVHFALPGARVYEAHAPKTH